MQSLETNETNWRFIAGISELGQRRHDRAYGDVFWETTRKNGATQKYSIITMIPIQSVG